MAEYQIGDKVWEVPDEQHPPAEYFERQERLARERAGVAQRYFVDQDEDSHWYLVPAERRDEWIKWRDLSRDDERARDPPAFARAIDGGPYHITFTDPQSR